MGPHFLHFLQKHFVIDLNWLNIAKKLTTCPVFRFARLFEEGLSQSQGDVSLIHSIARCFHLSTLLSSYKPLKGSIT